MISIICSTNRTNAVSKTISRIYQDILAKENAESILIDLADLPGDFIISALYENSGKNPAFNPIRQQMKKSEKFVFIVPEYNGSFPGVLKAFIDGLEFPSTFCHKKCALVGLSSGVQGGGLALSHLTDIFNYCGMHVLANKPKLAQIEDHLSSEGYIKSEGYQKRLEKQAKELIQF
ncbi:MAG: NAD(P)H-dependent oxidoreductase [Cyclobacteriaceae bacterium]|nr:NAD(P)H-dependent oxidoreductase [Cyclobacteriaceae bacterium HetDA_MAG_MS6]